ncbi:MAG: aspartate carbamoyltransferase regulatory subunit, partial [Promethearchaeota archaeon]
MSEKQLRVRKITQGTVIDHIPAGKALTVFKLLGISESCGEIISIAMNIPSSKIGKKDIIKIENIFLSEKDFNKIALIAPKATINKIQNTKIAKKEYVAVPDRLNG